MPHLHIYRGQPGSGKSTRAKNEHPDYHHYEPDLHCLDASGRYLFDMQLWPRIQELTVCQIDLALARGISCTLADVLPTLADLRPYLDAAKAHGATVNITDCTENYGNTHRVPLYVIRRMKSEWQPAGTINYHGT